MGSLAADMSAHDAALLNAIGDTASVGSTDVKGFFYRKPTSIETPNGGLVDLDLSFHCRYDDVEAWNVATEIEINGETFRFKRHVPEGGTESGWVFVELGRKL